jgi:predicted lipoprotein with Yx(FWY)xxD motif
MSVIATRAARSATLILSATFILAACQAAATASPSPTTAPTPTAAATATTSGSTYTINVGTGAVGSYLTGEDGKTLYVKQGDSTTATNCTGDCLANWPAFTLESGEDAAAGTGVSGAISTFTRPEGATQVTYNGQPLYYFGGDTKAGDTNGQGLAGVWSVATP